MSDTKLIPIPEPINPFEKAPIDILRRMYKGLCNEYRRRLCAMWDFPFEESWWHGNKIGSGLFLADWWCSIDMEELRYIVENNVTEKSWFEYCDFLESEINADRKPRINFFSWFELGARPEILKE